ncbi:MAG: 30S ribosomal protein S18 [Candidatus Moranbacteria bacterium]|nr:30S ribosomal protein S18 [Candidatus Moranbacteria bacterium]
MNRPNNNQPTPAAPKNCFFCANNINAIDYKDTLFLRRFMNSHAKIVSPRRTGNCAKHQRMVTNAIKRARTMALLSYTIK